MRMMKAVRMIETGRPLVEQAVPVPAIGPGDVLVRVKAAGICHSDVHYRAGLSPVRPLPLTLGHEVSGIVEAVGPGVTSFRPGDRVCLHYMITCGQCKFCHRGSEQFCTSGKMLGKYTDGGYAQYVAVPARSLFPLPAEIPFEQGAVMMCSSATSLHALRKARLQAGESVAIFGAGGLGLSAIQIAQAFGASQVFAVDLDPGRLALAERLGAIPIRTDSPGVASTTPSASRVTPSLDQDCQSCADEIRRLTGGQGVDVSLELVGLPATMKPAVASLAIFGRAVMVGLSDQSFPVAPYDQIINKEAEIIGCSDHLASEIPLLTELVRSGKLDLAEVVTATVPLDAAAINAVMDHMAHYGAGGVRTVIVP